MTTRIRYAPLVALLLPAPSVQARAQEDAGGVAAPVMAPPARAVTASSGGLSISAQPDATLGRVAVVRGNAPATAAGRRVRLQLQDPDTRRWQAVGRGRVARGGTFAAHWRPARSGRFTLRAVLGRASAPLALTVYESPAPPGISRRPPP